MNNNEALNEFFVWEENNSPGLKQNSLKNAEKDKCVITTETKTNVENLHWKDITDPKLRKKMKNKAWREANKNYFKTYRETNRNELLLKKRIYYNNNKDKLLLQKKENYKYDKHKRKAYYEANKDKPSNKTDKDKRKAYYEANKDKIRILKKDYRKKNKNNIKFKLPSILRRRLRCALKGNYKTGSAVKDLGCSIDELKSYLESKFLSGMSWDNYGFYGWHIDHIKPLASFDLTDRKQFLEACHYKNLQPLWAKDNLIKGDKLIQ